MLYGLYLSAAGVMTNSYRQDVIANNIANAETVGFKRDLHVTGHASKEFVLPVHERYTSEATHSESRILF